jgi:hypothetical protein
VGDPYAPMRSEAVLEVADPLDELLSRLTLLGCTAEEMDAVRSAWDDPTWTEDERYELTHMSDTRLVAEVRSARADAEFHSLTPDEQAAADAERAFYADVDAVNVEAFQTVHGSVGDVRRWVGTDAVRAYAALVYETTAPGSDPGVGRARTTLVEPLSRLVESGAPDGTLARLPAEEQ